MSQHLMAIAGFHSTHRTGRWLSHTSSAGARPDCGYIQCYTPDPGSAPPRTTSGRFAGTSRMPHVVPALPEDVPAMRWRYRSKHPPSPCHSGELLYQATCQGLFPFGLNVLSALHFPNQIKTLCHVFHSTVWALSPRQSHRDATIGSYDTGYQDCTCSMDHRRIGSASLVPSHRMFTRFETEVSITPQHTQFKS